MHVDWQCREAWQQLYRAAPQTYGEQLSSQHIVSIHAERAGSPHPEVQALQAVQLVAGPQHHRRAAPSTQLYAGLQLHAGLVLQPDAAVQAKHLGAAHQQHVKHKRQAGATLQDEAVDHNKVCLGRT